MANIHGGTLVIREVWSETKIREVWLNNWGKGLVNRLIGFWIFGSNQQVGETFSILGKLLTVISALIQSPPARSTVSCHRGSVCVANLLEHHIVSLWQSMGGLDNSSYTIVLYEGVYNPENCLLISDI